MLQGTSVISGSAKGVIVGAGNLSYVAGISAALPSGRTMNAFDYVSPPFYHFCFGLLILQCFPYRVMLR